MHSLSQGGKGSATCYARDWGVWPSLRPGMAPSLPSTLHFLSHTSSSDTPSYHLGSRSQSGQSP